VLHHFCSFGKKQRFVPAQGRESIESHVVGWLVGRSVVVFGSCTHLAFWTNIQGNLLKISADNTNPSYKTAARERTLEKLLSRRSTQ
jgi:hypothetical protein